MFHNDYDELNYSSQMSIDTEEINTYSEEFDADKRPKSESSRSSAILHLPSAHNLYGSQNKLSNDLTELFDDSVDKSHSRMTPALPRRNDSGTGCCRRCKTKCDNCVIFCWDISIIDAMCEFCCSFGYLCAVCIQGAAD